MNTKIYILLFGFLAYFFTKNKKKKSTIVFHEDEAQFDFPEIKKGNKIPLEDYKPYVNPIDLPNIKGIDSEFFERENDKSFLVGIPQQPINKDFVEPLNIDLDIKPISLDFFSNGIKPRPRKISKIHF